MEASYRVVFSGELLPGKDVEEVISSFSTRFRVKPQTARAVITSRGRQVLKRKLEAERAERYRAAFNKVGLVVEIEPMEPALALEPPASAPEPKTPKEPLAAAGETLMLASRELSPDVHAPLDAPDETPVQTPDASRWGEKQLDLEHVDGAADGAGGDDGRTRCPKCGAVAVSPVNGICDACGVVAERYLARLASEGQDGKDGSGATRNPYAPPRADLGAPAEGASGAFSGDPRAVAMGRGLGWISDAWAMFKVQPAAWVGAFLVMFVINLVLGMVPWLGTVATTLIGPILTAGLMLGAHIQYEGQPFKIEHLFAGFFRRPGQLALLALIYLAAFVVIILIVALLVGGVFVAAGGGVSPEGFDPNSLDLASSGDSLLLLALPTLLGMALSVPLLMAMLFAPALVAVDEVPVLRALELSFLGCARNMLPFLLYGLVGLVMVILGALPLMLGLLLVVPVLTIAIYIAYRDIYYL